MSVEEQDRIIANLIRENREKQQEFIAFTVKLNRIGKAMEQAGALMANLRSDSYESIKSDTAQGLISAAQKDVDVSQLAAMLHEYGELVRRLADNQTTIRRYGI